ncbi:MAG TPA: alpha-amylase family glycosyl hydrolase [Bacteroidales bacterium]|nr:alpha-amylase family glycosyl hydrolase [Bacteroidales bacterium]
MCKVRASIFIVFVLLSLVSCNKSTKETFNQKNDPINELASVVILKPGENVINLNDYILDFSLIDSVYYENSNYVYNSENNTLTITSDFDDIPPLSEISIESQGYLYSIICKKTCRETVEIIFIPEIDQEYSDVRVAGDFNSWNSENYEMKQDDGIWKLSLNLDCGLYKYQIVADGKYLNNSKSGDTIPNGLGGYNTILDAFQNCNTLNFKLETSYFEDNKITIGLSETPDKLIVLWQNQIIPNNLKNLESGNYTFEIPDQAEELDRSYIRVFACYENCVANDLFIPLKNGKVIDDIKDIVRQDKFSNIMYFILADRFYNGCSENDRKLSDNRVADKANYQGGDLYGVLEKLKEGYFDKLGINCLWISPLFKNPEKAYMEYPEPHRYFSGYHGYWPISLTEIDDRLGNDSIFKALVDFAHDKKMNVILDFVANHVHEDNPLYQNNKNWATQLNLDDGRKNIRIWEEHRLTTWFDTFLPSWDFNNQVVADTISQFAVLWLKKYNLDGFRHDATKHIPESFWRLLTKKIKTDFQDKAIFQIGETFGNRELIANYIGSGMMDSQFDFNLYFDARICFANIDSDMKILAKSLLTSLNYYGYHNLMGNITGNHDMIRFINMADESVQPGEDDQEAGWNRDIMVEKESSYQKLINLTAFIMSIPGVPCIYYGDEIGLPGVGDPDNRRMMKFDELSDFEKKTFDKTSKLIHIRKSNIEFLLGTTTVIQAEKNLLVIKRKYFEHESFIIFNQSNKIKDVLIPKSVIGNISGLKEAFDSEISENETSVQLKLRPLSCEILIKN